MSKRYRDDSRDRDAGAEVTVGPFTCFIETNIIDDSRVLIIARTDGDRLRVLMLVPANITISWHDAEWCGALPMKRRTP